MPTTFEEFVGRINPKACDDSPYYDPDGDCLDVISRPGDYLAQRIDPQCTLYRSQKSKKVIGFMLKGIKTLMRESGLVIAQGTNKKIKVSYLFIAHVQKQKIEPDHLAPGYTEAFKLAERVKDIAVCEV